MRARLASAFLVASAFAHAQAPTSQASTLGDRAVVELRIATPRAFVGQTVEVTLRVCLEERLWREHLIQLFRQHTDLAVRIVTPWAKALDGFEKLPSRLVSGTTATAIVDGSIVALRRLEDEDANGAKRVCFGVVQRLVCRRAGTLPLGTAELHFAWAQRFDEDLLGERVPQGRADVSLRSAPLAIEVTELPSEGRPPAFSGLVGEVAATASVSGAEGLRVGDAFLLRLAVSGGADLRAFRAPTLADLKGFAVRGLREEVESEVRTAIYELVAASAGPQTLPRFEIPYFSPTRARFEVAASAALDLAIAPAADGATELPGVAAAAAADGGARGPKGEPAASRRSEPVPGVDVPFGPLPVARLPAPAPRPDFAGASSPGIVGVVAWLAAPWLLFAFAWIARHHVRTRPERMLRRRRRAALRTLEHDLAQPGCERHRALVAFLAQGLACSEAAVVGPHLRERLGALGVEAPLAARTDALLDALAAPRFGGRDAPPDDATVLALAAEVERALLAFEHHARTLERRRLRGATWLAAALVLAPARAQESRPAVVDLPTEARRLLESGDAARALDAYRKALDAGSHDPAALCFDLGVCTQRLGRPAEAVLWYERALVVAPRHAEARANLRLVREQLGLVDRAPRPRLGVAFDGFVADLAALGPRALLALGAALQVLGLCGLWLARRRAIGVLLLVAGLACSGGGAARALASTGEKAVVLVAGARLMLEPHERASAIGALQPGQTLHVLEHSSRWARVRHGDALGWVEARAVAVVRLR